MIINYRFANGEKTQVEVDDSIGNVIIESRRVEKNRNWKERYHCVSTDAFEFEGIDYATGDFAREMDENTDERDAAVRKAFSHLTKIQKRRLIMLAGGLSIREIANREGKNFRTVYDSIEAARKKFLKYFSKTPHQNGL